MLLTHFITSFFFVKSSSTISIFTLWFFSKFFVKSKKALSFFLTQAKIFEQYFEKSFKAALPMPLFDPVIIMFFFF